MIVTRLRMVERTEEQTQLWNVFNLVSNDTPDDQIALKLMNSVAEGCLCGGRQ
jgi:hypothetical protein